VEGKGVKYAKNLASSVITAFVGVFMSIFQNYAFFTLFH